MKPGPSGKAGHARAQSTAVWPRIHPQEGRSHGTESAGTYSSRLSGVANLSCFSWDFPSLTLENPTQFLRRAGHGFGHSLLGDGFGWALLPDLLLFFQTLLLSFSDNSKSPDTFPKNSFSASVSNNWFFLATTKHPESWPLKGLRLCSQVKARRDRGLQKVLSREGRDQIFSAGWSHRLTLWRTDRATAREDGSEKAGESQG